MSHLVLYKMKKRRPEMIVTNDVWQIVDEALTDYLNHRIHRDLVVKASLGFNPKWTALQKNFWDLWLVSEQKRIQFATRVKEVLTDVVGIKRDEIIRNIAWCHMLANIRLQLAVTLGSTDDASILGRALDGGDINIIEAASNSSRQLAETTNITNNPIDKVVTEWFHGDARAVVRKILQRIENINPLAMVHYAYIKNHVQKLADYYEAIGGSYLEHCADPGLMSICHTSGESTLSIAMDDIIEQVVRMKIGHEEGFAYSLWGQDDSHQHQSVVSGVSSQQRELDKLHLAAALSARHQHILVGRRGVLDAKRAISLALQALKS